VKQILVDRTGQEVSVTDVTSVKEFSDKIGIPVAKVIGELMKNGVLVNLNARIDFDTCFLIGEAFGIKVSKELSEDVSVSDLMDGNIGDLVKEEDMTKLITRSPIISVMGHVDHGKTSILDYIRKSSVASGEAGGITQKIGAYQVTKNDKRITFLDTPGHEAFTIMRARGAKLTDIAVIVIAADEGMKPQTIESINHAKEAGVPIIVAANKMDKPGANLDLIRGQMAEHGLQPEDWGGDVVLVPVSAHTGLGMDTLLDMILLQAEMMELQANPDRAAVATVIEAHLDQKLGSVATILINTGTINKGDHIVCAGASGRVRTLKDYKGRNIDSALPGAPVQITGLSGVVDGGDILQSVSSPEIATTRAKEFSLARNTKSIHAFEGASLGMLMSRLKSGALKQLKVVLKTDSNGSLEALKAALSKLSTPETQVVFIHAAAGDVNQSDVMMAGTSQGLLIAYNVGVLPAAKSALNQSKIEFIDKKVIYHVLEKVESIITGMIDIRFEEQELGIARVKAIFYTGKNNSMMIVGMGVESGRVEPRAKVRVIRADSKVGSGEVANLKKGPLDVIEALEGEECGINFKGDVTVMEGDVLEFYKMVQRK
jgi:translation initiation factor IF-2